MLMNIYNDGHHFIGKLKCGGHERRGKRGALDPKKQLQRKLFREAWQDANAQELKGKERMEYVQGRYCDAMQEYEAIDGFAIYNEEEYNAFAKETEHLLHLRKKRFYRKAMLHEWNFFCTFTYSDEKMSAEEFFDHIRRTLSNFHSRYGWNYCAVFEEGEEGGRMHLHALMYIPEGMMRGKLVKVKRYSKKAKRLKLCLDNTFFQRVFGNNDFQPITKADYQRTAGYLLKYMTKSSTKIIYSRGVPVEHEGVEMPEEGVLMVYRTQTGYNAILADSLFGLDAEIDNKYVFDLGEIDPYLLVRELIGA